MQSVPPPFFVSGPPNCQQFYPVQQQRGPFPPQLFPGFPPYPCPDVVGEGEVTSVVQPDGSVQFYFRPAPTPWCTNAGAYYITSISNCSPVHPLRLETPPCYNPPCQIGCAPPRCQLKFHNDQDTSTDDFECTTRHLRSLDKCANCIATATQADCDCSKPGDKLCRCDLFTKSMTDCTMSKPGSCCGGCPCKKSASSPSSSFCSSKLARLDKSELDLWRKIHLKRIKKEAKRRAKVIALKEKAERQCLKEMKKLHAQCLKARHEQLRKKKKREQMLMQEQKKIFCKFTDVPPPATLCCFDDLEGGCDDVDSNISNKCKYCSQPSSCGTSTCASATTSSSELPPQSVYFRSSDA